MSFSVKLFYNTGFNGLNVPGEQSIIDNMSHDTFDPLDILQAGMLPSVSIRASWNNVRGADYCCVYNSSEKWYYVIESIVMQSEDVATLVLTIDPWTTISCINGISEFLDGITDRHHVATSEDTFGAFVENDPYLVPSKALELESGGQVGNIDYSGNTLIEATVDLGAMGTAQDGVEYTVAATGNTCVVPQVVKLTSGQYTDVHVGSGTYRTPVSSYFNPTDAVMEGVQKLRSLGAEGSILNCWKVPNSATYDHSAGHDRISLITDNFHTVALPHSLPYAFANVQNKRVLYGELCKYIMLSVSTGNTASFNPEDIFDGTESNSPKVKYIADPRPNGSPHFRFEYFLGDNDNSSFWQNCIQGLPNPSAPLIYTDKSGSEIDRMIFNTKQNIANEDAAVASIRSAIGLATSSVDAGASAYLNKAPEGLFGKAVQLGMRGWDWASENAPFTTPWLLNKTGVVTSGGLSQYIYDEENIRRQYQHKRASELQEFRLNTEIVAPTVNFPRSETLRDFVGNGVYIYRIKPSLTDINKFDKILNMYGYKDTAPATKSMLSNRSKFNYIRIAGASVKTVSQIPMWLRNLVSIQLSNGIRIWHEAPNTAYYTNGQNV